MKVAIVHDSFLYIGGAERVLLVLLEMFPKSDVFISLVDQRFVGDVEGRTSGKLSVSAYSYLPWMSKFASFLKPMIFKYWEGLDLSRYDLVVSSSHSFSSKSVITKFPTFHISYIHTPPRYLYQVYSDLEWIKKPWIKTALSPLMRYLRQKDYQGAQRPDVLVANSKEVQGRIKKYYKRKSELIYPPVELHEKESERYESEYYIFVSRLVKQKGVELAVGACRKLKRRLVVVGKGPERSRLERSEDGHATFRGFVSDAKMVTLYRKAKALIYPAIDEDFGMVVVEALAHGVPVIGYRSGSIKETVVDGKTGVLFDDYSSKGLTEAIIKFEKLEFKTTDCRLQAEKFSREKFIKKFIGLVEKGMKKL